MRKIVSGFKLFDLLGDKIFFGIIYATKIAMLKAPITLDIH